MTLSGTTRDFPLDVLLRLLADTKKTGELSLRGSAGEGALGLAEGRVVAAVFGDEPPIPALGAIFDLADATFEFTPWDEAPAANLEGDLDDLRRKAEEHRRWLASVREVIPNDRMRFRLSERAADQGAVTFTADRWRVVLAVNGQRDVADIASQLGIDTYAALDLLAGLVRDGVIDALEVVEAPPAAVPWSAALEPPPEAPAPPVAEPEPSASAYAAPEPAPAAPEPPAQTWSAAAPEPPTQAWSAAAPEPWPAPEEAAALESTTPAPEPPSAEAPAPEPPAPEPPAEAAPSWSATPATDQWAPAAPAEPEPAPAMDDRLAALFGTAPAAPAEPAATQWTPPAADEWAPAAEAAWSPAVPEAPAAPEPSLPADDPRLAAMMATPAAEPPVAEAPMAGSEAPAANEWAPPPSIGAPQKKSLFGRFRREEAAPEPATRTTLVDRSASSRAGLLAAFSNALLTEYNSGHYGKNRVDERMSGLLMRVDEQADPIDRPLPVVDDRLDVQALERTKIPDEQSAPYLATLVATIYADAEKAFGRDKAKRGFKAAQQHVFGGDLSSLAAPDVAGKLPKV